MMDAYSRQSVTIIFTPCRRRHSPYLPLLNRVFYNTFQFNTRDKQGSWEKFNSGKRFTLFYSLFRTYECTEWQWGWKFIVSLHDEYIYIYIYIYLCVNSLQTIVALTQIFFSRFTERERKYFFINSIASHCRVNMDFFQSIYWTWKANSGDLISTSFVAIFVHVCKVSRNKVEIFATSSCG